jgi:hypothetical protein
VQTPYRGMLTLYDFENLSFYEKAQYLWDNGLYLSDRTYSQFRITLYYLDDYFAEVMYNRVGNKIISIASFDHKAVLLKYADEIDLKDLF